jgi:hypothetical protein
MKATILLLLLLPMNLMASPHKLRKVFHVAMDSMTFASMAADAASTVHVERICPSCRDNGFGGPHPTEAAVWGGTMGTAAFVTVMSHLIPRHLGGDTFFHLFLQGPVIVAGYADVKDNVGTK